MGSPIYPDKKWRVIYGIGAHREFVERFRHQLYIKPEVQGDIRAIFRVIQQLLILSYFEYELVKSKAMFTSLEI